MLADAGFDHLDARRRLRALPGVLGLSAWERVFEKERWRELADRRYGARLAAGESAQRSARLAAARGRARGALRRAPARCSSTSRRLFAGDDRDERDARPRRCTRSAIADGAVAGAVRLYPLGAGAWKGDRLAVLPEARHGALGARLVRFAVADRGRARRARGWSRMIQLPNVRFFEPLGWRRDGDAAAFHGRQHQPMAIALTPRVSGSAARSHTSADSPPPASRSTRGGVEGAARRAGQAAARESLARRLGVLGRGGEHEAEAREGEQPALERRHRRGSAAVEVERRAAAAPARASAAASRRRRASRRRGRRGKAALGDLDERLAVVAQQRRVAVAQRGEDRRLVACIGPPGRRPRAARRRAGRAAARSGVVTDAGAEGGQRRRRAEREVAADDRDAEPVGRPRKAVEHAVGVGPVGADERVDERRAGGRPSRARRRRWWRPRRRRRANGSAVSERRRDRLAAEHELPSPCGDDGGVVAVDANGRPSSRRSSRLASSPGASRTAAAR